MSNMILFGNGLQSKYSTVAKSDLSTNAQRKQSNSDREALSKVAKAKRDKRMGRLQERDDNRKSYDEMLAEEIAKIPNKQKLKIAEIEARAKSMVEARIEEAKKNTNRLAREHGLTAPNNPEAVKHDRFHCFSCGGKLHIPDAYQELDDSVKGLFDDTTVQHLCCFCFAKEEVISIKEATADIRLAVYNPVESVDKNIDIKDKVEKIKKMSDLEALRLKSKMKKYQNVVNLIGNVKHDYLQEGDDFENQVRNRAKTRYNACTI